MSKKTIKKEPDGKTVSSAAGVLGAAKNRKVIQSWKKNNEGISPQRWWVEEPKNLYKSVDAVINTLETSQSARRLQHIQFARLYGNYDALGLPTANLLRSTPGMNMSNPVSLNIIQSVIDSVSAKIAKDQPKVSFVTTGADDYFLKIRSTKLTKYMSGLFKQAKVYDNAENVFRDACVLGTGFIKLFVEDSKIKSEWCPIDEIRVDDLDGLKQKPRSIHQVRLVARDMLLINYPEYEREINQTQSALVGKVALQSTVDMIRVIESWHLPTTKKSGDGIHCITIDNCTLFSEEYKKDYFPIVPFRWYNRTLGYYGRSITEEIKTIQIEINKILRVIQQSQELAAVPIIFVPNEAEIAEDVLASNAIARLVPYSGGNPPQFFTPTAQNPEVYQHLNSLIQWAFQTVGLSQASASGMKPSGVNSAVAMREVSDIETGRFAMNALRWEQFFVEIAKILVDISKDLYTDEPELMVTVAEKKILKEIRWKDVDLEDHPFEIQTFPTSQLPDTPAGRIQTITEYIQNNWISKERGMELLNLDPDLESEVNLQTASLRLTEKWLAEMVEEGTIHHPEPFMNLQLAQEVAQGVYNQLVYDNCPEERLDLVRQFIMEIVEMLNPPPSPQQMPPMQEQLPPEMQGQLPPEMMIPPPGTQPIIQGPAPQAPVGPAYMQQA